MGFNRFTKNVLNISGLPDRVQNQAAALKALFDQSGVDIKAALNQLMAELEAETAAGNIGADVASVTTKTVQAILTAYEQEIADRYTKLESDALISENTNSLVQDVDINLTTGVITVKKKDGTVETFDTAIEKVPAKFEIVETNGRYALKITNVDGTSTQTDITNLMNIYTFNNSDTVNFAVTGEGNEKTVVANIKANSIGLDKLSLTVVTTLEGYMNSARDSANAAKISENNAKSSENVAKASAETAKKGEEAGRVAVQKATEAESYAHGGTGTRQGEDTDNAKYYSQIAKEAAGGDFVTPTEMEAYAQPLGTTPTYETTELSGQEIEVDAPLNIESILHLNGNREQDSRSGINKLLSFKSGETSYFADITNVNNGTNNYYKAVPIEDNWIHVECDYTDSSISADGYIKSFIGTNKVPELKPSTTYSIIVEFRNVNKTNMSRNMSYGHTLSANTGKVWEGASGWNISAEQIVNGAKIIKNNCVTSASITVSELLRNFHGLAKGDKFSYDYRISVVEGSVTEYEYEPYGVQPSPDYPSEIRNVSGDVEVKVEGKNLLNLNLHSLNSEYSYVNGVLSISYARENGGCRIWSGSGVPPIDKCMLLSAGTYTISAYAQSSLATQRPTIYVLASDGSKMTELAKVEGELSNTYQYISATFRLETNTYVSFAFQTNGVNCTQTTKDIQLEEGSTATPYVSYVEPTIVPVPLGDIELRSTPDGTRDTFERVDGVWNKVEKAIPFAITEDMLTNVDLTYYGVPIAKVSRPKGALNGYIRNICLMTSYKEREGSEKRHGIFNTASSSNYIEIFNENITSLETAKTILAGETGIIKLATPTYTPITDTALISALDELEELILHKGYNRITATAVNGVKAYLDLSIPSTASVTNVVETESSLDMPVLVAPGTGDVKAKITDKVTVNPATGEVKVKGDKVATVKHAFVTIPVTGWNGTSPYYIDIPVQGLKATDKPHYGLVYSTDGITAADKTTRENEQLAFNEITMMIANEDSLRVICDNQVPLTQITLQLEVVR